MSNLVEYLSVIAAAGLAATYTYALITRKTIARKRPSESRPHTIQRCPDHNWLYLDRCRYCEFEKENKTLTATLRQSKALASLAYKASKGHL